MAHRNRRIILFSLLTVIALSVGFFLLAVWPRISAQNQTIAIAKKAGQLSTSSDFMIYRRNQTYYSVTGYNQNNRLTYVIINGKSGKIKVLNGNKGKTKAQVKQLIQKKYQPKKIYHVNLGLSSGDPVWEVALKKANGKLSYRLVDYYSGKTLNLIDNL